MDFIEQLFGMSPDGGSGATEALWLVAIAAVVGAGWYIRRRRAQSR